MYKDISTALSKKASFSNESDRIRGLLLPLDKSLKLGANFRFLELT